MTIQTILQTALAALRRPRQHHPLRVGLLNTGELILVDEAGHSQVLSSATTDVVRDVLFADDLVASERVLFPHGAPVGDDPTARMHG